MAVMEAITNTLTGGKKKHQGDLADVPEALPLESFGEWQRLGQQRLAVLQKIDAADRRLASLSERLADEARDLLEGRGEGELDAEIAAARRERRVAAEALALADRDRQALLGRLSRAATEGMAPWFRAVWEAQAKAALHLWDLMQLERRGLERVAEQGYTTAAVAGHGPARPTFLDEQDLWNWLSWLVDAGYLPANAHWRATIAAIGKGG